MEKINQLLHDLDYVKTIYKDIVKTYIENNFDIKGKYNESDLKLFVKFNRILTYYSKLLDDNTTREYIKDTGKIFVLEMDRICTEYYSIKHFDNVNYDIISGICAFLENIYGNDFFMSEYTYEYCPIYMHGIVADNIEIYYKQIDKYFDKIFKLLYNSTDEYMSFISLVNEK